MPGVNIGGATYTLSLDDQNFVRQLQHAEQTANARAQSIRRQLGALPLGHPDIARFQADLAQAEAAAARASGQIQSRLGQIGPSASASSRIMSSSFVAGFAQIAAASVGLNAIIAEFKSISAAAQDAQNVQRSLNVQYGRSAQDVTRFTDELAASQGRGRTEFKQAAADVSSLTRNYGLNAAEIKKVLQISSDLAAVSGKDVADATHRVEAAIRGEAESSEILGLSLQQNALQGSELLTASEKKRLVTMGNVEAAHLRLRVIEQQAAYAQGAANKQVVDGTNQLQRLDAATKNLNTTLGESTNVNIFAGYLATATTSAENLVKITDILAERNRKINELRARDTLSQRQPTTGQAVLEGVTGISLVKLGLIEAGFGGAEKTGAAYEAELERIKQATNDTAKSQTVFAQALDRFNTEPAQQQAEALSSAFATLLLTGEALAANAQQIAGAYGTIASGQQTLPIPKAQNERLVKEAKDTTDQIVATEKEGIRQRQEAYDHGADQAIASAERERDGLLAASLAKRDGALAALKDEQKASDAYYAVQQRNYERDRDAALKTADAVKSARLAAIKGAEDAETARVDTLIRNNERERDHEIAMQKAIYDYQVEQGRLAARKLADSRTEADRLTRDSRHEFDQARATDFAAQTAADKTRHEQRVANLKQESDSAKAAGDLALKAIDREKSALQDSASVALKGLDDQRNAEQRRHDAAIANIDQEAARQSAAIQQQLDALDATTAAESRQREDRSQRGDVTTARQGVREAHQSGDPEAIKRAQLDLAQALDAISQTSLNRRREAERTSLQAQLANVQQRAQAEKDAADKALAEQQARLDAEKQATRDQLATALTALAARADAEKTATDGALTRIQSRTDAEKTEYDAHTAAAQQAYAADSARIDALRQQRDDARADQRLKEDRAIDDSNKAQQAANDDAVARIHALYDDPDTGILSRIKADQDASKERFQAERDDAQRTYDGEAERIHTLYDDPDNGLLAKLALAKTAADESFSARALAADATYKAEQLAIATTYNGPFGLIQRLKDAKDGQDAIFKAASTGWSTWGDTIKKALDDVNPKLLETLGYLQQIAALGGTPVGNGQDPGGFTPGTTIPNTSGGALTAPQSKTNPELAKQFSDAGLSVEAIAAACAPIAAAGLAEAFGNAAEDIDPGKLAARLPSSVWDTAVGSKNFPAIAAAAGVHVHEGGQAEALAALKAGSPVVINEMKGGSFPGHYLLAQGIDAAGNLDIGNTGAAVSLGRSASLGQIASKGSGLRFYVPDPTNEQAARRAGTSGSGAASNPGAGGVGGAVAQGSSGTALAAYIKQKATSLGYADPGVPVRVWMSEGGVTDSGQSNVVYQGKREQSYGPFQLNYGGGLGDTFSAATGIRPGDPRFEHASVDWALGYAFRNGWRPWHGWTGPEFAGIQAMAGGGMIDRLTGLVDMKTGSLYATAGEGGRKELVVPMRGSSPAAVPPPAWSSPAKGGPDGAGNLYLQVSVGGRVLEDYTINVMDRAQRDGRFRAVPRA